MKDIESKFVEGADTLGDSVIDTIGSALDAATAVAKSKGGELLGGLGATIKDGAGSMKRGISDTIAPNSIGKARSDSSPAVQQTPAPSKSPDTPSQNFSSLIQNAGFSKESLSSIGAEVTDLGSEATVGYDDVACSPQTAARAMSTNFHTR